MKILVCVKHVPGEEDMKLDPVTKTLIRKDSGGVISDLDKYALEMAVKLKEQLGGNVTAISMGPAASQGSLKYSLSVGADDVYLLSDRALGGSDAYATAAALTAGIRKLEQESGELFDLILCGRQASDSDTSLVTPALAEMLDRPHSTGVFEYETADDGILVMREIEHGSQQLKLMYPAVLSVTKGTITPRYPNIRLKLAANRRQIPVWGLSELGLDAAEVGTMGSLTSVGDSYVPEHNKACVVIKEANESESAIKLAALLVQAKKI